MGNCFDLAVLLLRYGWMVSLSRLHSRRGPDYQQDLYDAGGRGKHTVAALSRPIASPDSVLLKVRGNAETLDSIGTALSQILGCPGSLIIHIIIQQRQNPNEDQLDGAIAALEKSIPVKDQLVTMRDANRVTLLAANLSKPFNPPVPVQVTLLDYYGRQLEIGAAANDITQLKQTASNISGNWNALRPVIESHGGSAEAQKFDHLVARVETAKSVNEYSSLATPLLNQVDNLEKVFKQ